MKRNCLRSTKFLGASALAFLAVSNCISDCSLLRSFGASSAFSGSEVSRDPNNQATLNTSSSIHSGHSGGTVLNNALSGAFRTDASLPFSRLVRRTFLRAASPFVPNINATLADALLVDNNNSGKADPGDTLMYTVTITNSDTDATGVTFTDDLSQNGGNLTLVPGSVMSAPVARDDAYPNGVGNTGMTANAAAGVLANDYDPDGATPTAIPITNGPTGNGGTVTLATDGSFTYDPPVGFTGTDTFTYTATDGVKTDTGTVSITLTERVWYVNSAAAVDGDGRSNTPFKVITGHLDGAGGAGDVDSANDYIFLFAGSYSVTTLPLESGQRLIGQGVNLVVNSQTLVTATTKPTLTGSATAVILSTGNTVSGLDVNGASGITGSSVGALIVSVVGVTGSNGPAVDLQTTGALSVQFDSLSSSGGGIGMRLTSPTSGAFTVTGATTVNKTSGTGDGITITGGGATTTFTGAVSVTTFSGKGIVANAAGAITITSGSSMVDATAGAALDLASQNLGSGWNFGLLKSSNSAAEGIKIQGCSQNLAATTTNIQTPTGAGIDIQNTFGTSTINFGTTTVNKTSAGTGVNLASNGAATVSFGALNITAANGSGLVAATSGTVNATSGTINATSGPALDLASVMLGLTLTGASSTNSIAKGMNLTSVSGGLSIGTTSLTNPATNGINATSSTASLNFGSTTANGSGGAAILLGGGGVGNTGPITFSALNVTPDNGQRGLLAQENSNTITTTSGAIGTNSATALEITRSSGTTPLSIALTSVATTGGSSSSIILTNTNGAFTINGAGTTVGSGGTIQTINGADAIKLTSTGGLVTLKNMAIQDITASSDNSAANDTRSGVDAIHGQTVSGGLTLNNVQIRRISDNGINGSVDGATPGPTVWNGLTITNCLFEDTNRFNVSGHGDAQAEGAVYIQGIRGTVSVTGTTFQRAGNGLFFDATDTSGTLDLTVQSNSFLTLYKEVGTSSIGTYGIFVRQVASLASTVRIGDPTESSASLGNTFTNGGDRSAIDIIADNGSTGNLKASIAKNTFTVTDHSSPGQPPGNTIYNFPQSGVLLRSTGSAPTPGSGNYEAVFAGNTFNECMHADGGIGNLSIIMEKGDGEVIVRNNTFNKTWDAPVELRADGQSGAQSSAKVLFTGNTYVDGIVGDGTTDLGGQSPYNAFYVQARNSGKLDLTMQNETTPLGLTDTSSATGSNSFYSQTTTAGDVFNLFLQNIMSPRGFRLKGDSGAFNLYRNGSASATPQGVLQDNGNRGGGGVDTTNPPSATVTGTINLTNTPPALPSIVTPFHVTPEDAAASAVTPQSLASQGGEPDSAYGTSTLFVAQWEKPSSSYAQSLLQVELNWMAQAAIARWAEAGIAVGELERLQSVSFEITDLPRGQLAQVGEDRIRVSETAAGYGWYFDQTPQEDSEFLVPVPGRELQTTEYSPAHGKVDLLTVLVRQLGQVYVHGKDRMPKSLRRDLAPLMEDTLSPGVRRLPLDQWKVTTLSPTGSLQPSATPTKAVGQTHTTEVMPTREVIRALVAAVGFQPSWQAGSAASTIIGPADYVLTHWRPATLEAAMLSSEPWLSGPYVAEPVPAVATIDEATPRFASANEPRRARLDNLGTAVIRPQDVAVIGLPATLLEPDGLKHPRYPAKTARIVADQGPKPPQGASSGGVVSVGPFNLPAGETVTIMFSATIDTPVTPAGTTQVCTRGTVTADGGISVQTIDPGPPVVNGATCTTLAQANLAVTKTDTPDPVFAGSNITYIVDVINNGSDAAFNASLTDAIPANTTFISTTPPAGWTRTDSVTVGAAGTLSFTKPSMINGETASFTIVVQVDNATLGGTIITNNAVIASDTPDGTQGNNTGAATTTVTAQADLAVTKSDSPDPVIAGNNITYTINFVNNGPGSAVSTTVTDLTPTNTTLVSAVVTTGSGWSTSAPAVGGTGNVVFSKPTVPNGESAVFTVVVKVNANTANGATISNSVTASSATPDPTPGNDTGTATTTVNTQADLAVTKSDSPDPVSAGANLSYTVNFVNNGPSDAQTVTVTDAIPANTTFVSAVVTTGSGWSTSAPAVGGTGNVVFSKATVGAAETAVFTIVVKVNSNTADGATISNDATAATATTDPTPGNNTANATTTVQTRADLSVTKSDSPDPVTAGNNLTYTINFANNGPSDAQTVTVTDPIPANATFVSATVAVGGGWSVSAPAVGGTGNVVFSKTTSVAGDAATFTIVININPNTANGTVITNNATAASATTDPTPGNNTGTATTTVQAVADLAVTKTDSPDPVNAGSNITYTINFANNGPSFADAVTVTDAVPADATFVSATVTTGTGWSTSAPAVGGTGNVVFSKASVANGETAVFTIVVKVNSNTASGTTITNTAVAASATTDPTPGNNTGTATTSVQAQADLAVTKTDSPDPVIAGNNLTYTINLVNNGPSDAQTVTVTDAVPADSTFVSATVTTGSGWSTSAPAIGGTGNIVFSKAVVTSGETAVFTIVVNINANTANGATITNSATAAAATGDPVPGNNTSTATTTVQTQADLAVTKSDSPDPVIAGNNLTYTINFANNGPSDAQTVTVTDAVPANATFVSASVMTGSGWGGSSPAVGATGDVVFSKATVAAGESAVFTIVVNINSNTASGATITNSAVAATATTDPTPGNNTGTATTTVQTQADIAVTKTDSPDPVFAGANLTYTINFANNGPSDAQTVTVTDAAPANSTFVSAVVTTGTGWSVSAPAAGATGNVVFSKASVTASETAVFTMVVRVNSDTASGSTITNTAVGASPTTDPTPSNNTGSATTTVQTQADLAVVKSDSPDPVVASQNLTYTIDFVNNGPSDAQSVTVTDPMPPNTTFVSASVKGKKWSTSAPAVGGTGTITFSKATVAAGETAVFTIVLNVNLNTPNNTTLTNTATAASATADPTPGNNSSTTTTLVLAQADLALTKSNAPDPACVGEDIVYTVSLINNGPGPGINTTVTDAVPANTTFVSATVTTGSGWSVMAPAVGGTGNVVFSKASVGIGETAVFQIAVKVSLGTLHGTVITNTATAASAIPDPAPGNNSAMASTTVDPIAPAITCPANITTKAANPGDPCVIVNYPAPAASDNCPGVGVVCVPPSGSCFPLGTTTVTCTATDLAGNTASCTFNVTVFDLCVQDDGNPSTVVLINSITGDYRFCCDGVTYTGKGTITRRGSLYTLEHNKAGRRVLVKDDESVHKGSGSLQAPPGTTRCTITDRNTQDNSCACQ